MVRALYRTSKDLAMASLLLKHIWIQASAKMPEQYRRRIKII